MDTLSLYEVTFIAFCLVIAYVFPETDLWNTFLQFPKSTCAGSSIKNVKARFVFFYPANLSSFSHESSLNICSSVYIVKEAEKDLAVQFFLSLSLSISCCVCVLAAGENASEKDN